MGDTFLLANAPAYVIANDLDREPEDGIAFFDWEHSNIARHGGGETALIGGSFVIGGGNARLLLDALPPFIHIPASDRGAALLAPLATLDDELEAGQMGSTLMTRRMGGTSCSCRRCGPMWAGRCCRNGMDRRADKSADRRGDQPDPQRPGHRWTVEALATRIGMSRSALRNVSRNWSALHPRLCHALAHASRPRSPAPRGCLGRRPCRGTRIFLRKRLRKRVQACLRARTEALLVGREGRVRTAVPLARVAGESYCPSADHRP